jgi:hypothetical protein
VRARYQCRDYPKIKLNINSSSSEGTANHCARCLDQEFLPEPPEAPAWLTGNRQKCCMRFSERSAAPRLAHIFRIATRISNFQNLRAVFERDPKIFDPSEGPPRNPEFEVRVFRPAKRPPISAMVLGQRLWRYPCRGSKNSLRFSSRV